MQWRCETLNLQNFEEKHAQIDRDENPCFNTIFPQFLSFGKLLRNRYR